MGWSQGWLELGGRAVGFDLEHEAWHGPIPAGAELVIQDVLTLHGKQFKDASLILGSSPCQEFSYRAMPWKRARELPPPYLGMELFEAQFRIQREACEAAGRYIPLVVENVRGAQKWVGRSRWHFGSYHLWGDVPALMPHTLKGVKVGGLDWNNRAQKGQAFNTHAEHQLREEIKNSGGSWFKISHNKSQPTRGDRYGNNPVGLAAGRQETLDGLKGAGHGWFNDAKRAGVSRETGRLSQSGSKSPQRRAAAAAIARIPYTLSRHIAETYWPDAVEQSA